MQGAGSPAPTSSSTRSRASPVPGKAPTERTHFSENHGSVAAYGIFSHRHTAEIEQELGREVTFVPHLVPLDRGILETIYVRVAPGTTDEAVGDAYERAYANAPFVRLTGDALPEIKHVAHTNFCDIGWRLEPGGQRLVVVSCLDNLLKGAASQAVQNFNLASGLDETTRAAVIARRRPDRPEAGRGTARVTRTPRGGRRGRRRAGRRRAR